ncbi:hypothetical protein T440DRAFT_467117 [Plenodomus tracheiphilus IPT5]|uniref:Zn(2)-C6 fungal-type domain-containing protein n=1 Tax=Plenodomus tracheiphilus IPT5 TaxID=1408161 RepID=A0A6A7BA73_9PLEO|nr:hypothetical protein T440DRAFT_467117 [Plenodomus tracheiphilus IPT5]
MATSIKGCWTCKDRKVSCDRTTPTCHRCTKAKRICGLDYEQRVSKFLELAHFIVRKRLL